MASCVLVRGASPLVLFGVSLGQSHKRTTRESLKISKIARSWRGRFGLAWCFVEPVAGYGLAGQESLRAVQSRPLGDSFDEAFLDAMSEDVAEPLDLGAEDRPPRRLARQDLGEEISSHCDQLRLKGASNQYPGLQLRRHRAQRRRRPADYPARLEGALLEPRLP